MPIAPAPSAPRRGARTLLGLVLVLALAAATSAGPRLADAVAAPATDSAAGSTHRGDTLFPGLGTTAYDVRHYAVALHYQPADNRLRAVTTVTARSRAHLRRVVLDLEGLHVTQVRADARRAPWSRHGDHLVVRPRRALGHRFTITVAYHGVPEAHTDTDDSTEGWVRTADGAIGLGEPVGTMDWVPSNNTPGDKATWTYAVDVPDSVQVAANGNLRARSHHGARTTWHWRETDPMTTYLATVAIGHFRLFRSLVGSVDGRRIPVLDFVDPSTSTPSGPAAHDSAAARRQLPAVLRFEERLFGPYPFTSTGMIVDDADVGYALETQTRPFYPGTVDALVHEMAHQWYGDSASFVDWHDIWLAEGFATYAEWLWTAAHGGESTQAQFDSLYAKPAGDDLWSPAPTRFAASKQLFGEPVYSRGAMTLQALRNRVGDRDFFRILKDWPTAHRHGSTRTADFVRLAERISGRHLGGLFRTWLVRDGKPRGY